MEVRWMRAFAETDDGHERQIAITIDDDEIVVRLAGHGPIKLSLDAALEIGCALVSAATLDLRPCPSTYSCEERAAPRQQCPAMGIEATCMCCDTCRAKCASRAVTMLPEVGPC